MKKLTSLVLATGMVLSLAACGGSGSSTAASTTNTGDSTGYHRHRCCGRVEPRL